MKYLVLFAVLAVVYAVWRAQRRAAPPPKDSRRRRPIAPPQDMVRCAHCGVHLPREDAVAGGAHLYCSTAHRDRGPA